MNRRQMLAAAGGGALLVATGTAVFAASRARTPAERAAQALPPEPSVVTARVRVGELVDELVIDGSLDRAEHLEVPAPLSIEGASRLVVTKLPIRKGQRVRSGDLLAEVSGRPVIALDGAFPTYRDMTLGATGGDVSQLQRALRKLYGTPVSGRFDSRTEHDVSRLYRRIGYTPVASDVAESTTPAATQSPQPGDAGSADAASHIVLPAGELAFVPSLPADVAAVHRRVGQEASGPLVTLAAGEWQVVSAVDEATAQALADTADSADGGWAFADGPLHDKETSLVEIREPDSDDDDDVRGGTDAVFAVSGQVKGLAVGDIQQVRLTRARSPKDSPIVPVSALWTAADGSVSLTVVEDSGAQRTVPVRVLLNVRGECAVAGPLLDGERVVISANGGPGA